MAAARGTSPQTLRPYLIAAVGISRDKRAARRPTPRNEVKLMTTPSDITIAIDEYGIRSTEAGHTPQFTYLNEPVMQVAEVSSAADWREICNRTGYQPITIREAPPIQTGVAYLLADVCPAPLPQPKRATFLNREQKEALLAGGISIFSVFGLVILILLDGLWALRRR